MKKKLLSLITVTALCVGLMGVGVAGAVRVSTYEGGTWEYGTGYFGNCYSDYYHGKRVHGSSARNGKLSWATAYGRSAGTWAYARIPQTLSGNQAYYCHER